MGACVILMGPVGFKSPRVWGAMRVTKSHITIATACVRVYMYCSKNRQQQQQEKAAAASAGSRNINKQQKH